MRYLIVLNDEDYLDVYDIKHAPEDVVEAVIALVRNGYTVPCQFSETYWKENLENVPLINELNKVMQITQDHRTALCDDYSEVEE